MLGALIPRIEKICRNFDITVYIPITSNTREDECGLNVEACRFGGLVLYPGQTPICLHAQKVQAIFSSSSCKKKFRKVGRLHRDKEVLLGVRCVPCVE